MMRLKVIIPALLVALVSVLVGNVINTTRPFKSALPFNDSSRCKLLDGPWGAEDMVVTASGWIITSSLDLGHFLEDGIEDCGKREKSGGLWTFRPEVDVPPVRIEHNGGPCFMTHGLFLSNSTNRLYAVTHHGTFSSVEIFSVESTDSQDEPPTLTWVRSVTSESFPNLGLNDVVEGAHSGELYVTQFLPSFASIPTRGRKHPESLLQTVQQALLVPVFLLGLKLTTVHHCTFTEDLSVPADCRKATDVSFRMANGITISDDRSMVFVNDATGYSITTFRRNELGALIKTGVIELDHNCDNIEWKDKKLWTATIPDMLVVVQNEGKPFEHKSKVPGGLAVITQDDDGNWTKQHVAYNHDGSMLSQISSGMSYGGRTILGSPSAYGVLVCEE